MGSSAQFVLRFTAAAAILALLMPPNPAAAQSDRGAISGKVSDQQSAVMVVQYGRRLFGVYAHMQQGSAMVSVGDWVEQGQILGLVGNSGNTTEPHLHVHFTDRWAASEEPVLDIYFSQGVPAIFWGGQVVRGDRVFPLNGTTPLERDAIVP